MSSQSMSLQFVHELRLVFLHSQRLMLSCLRLSKYSLNLLLWVLMLPLKVPHLKLQSHPNDHEGEQVELPSQRPNWVFGQLPVGPGSVR